MSDNVLSMTTGRPLDGEPTPGTLVLTEKARDTLGLWLHQEDTDGDSLARALGTLIRMGARGFFESESLITFATPTLTVGMYRDRKGEITLYS